MIASHITFGGYEFWLPNDPRGSGSKEVRKRELRLFGQAKFIAERRRSRAASPNNPKWQRAAKSVLAHPPAKIDERQREMIASGFSTAIGEAGYVVPACAILSDHAHLIVAACKRPPRIIERHLKSKATMALRDAGA